LAQHKVTSWAKATAGTGSGALEAEMRKSLSILFPALAMVALATAPALAAGASPLVVTFDKATVIHLDAPARRVIVGNPMIADVSVEEPTLLYVFGKAPGETSIIVLGADNKEIMARPVVVTTEPDRLLTVHAPGGDGPVNRNYSCVANRCLKVASPEASAVGAVAPAATPAPGGAAPIPMDANGQPLPPAQAGAGR
jgi:hypothetical protein